MVLSSLDIIRIGWRFYYPCRTLGHQIEIICHYNVFTYWKGKLNCWYCIFLFTCNIDVNYKYMLTFIMWKKEKLLYLLYLDTYWFIQAKDALPGPGLLLDLHGQGHQEAWIELGYVLHSSDLDSASYNASMTSVTNFTTTLYHDITTLFFHSCTIWPWHIGRGL